MLICFGITFCIPIALRFYLIWENRRRDRLDQGNIGDSIEDLNAAILDKTDKELLHFRYVY
jgi:hypothetical protein